MHHSWHRSHVHLISAQSIHQTQLSTCTKQEHNFHKNPHNPEKHYYKLGLNIKHRERDYLGRALGRERVWGGLGGKSRGGWDSCRSQSCMGSHGCKQESVRTIIPSHTVFFFTSYLIRFFVMFFPFPKYNLFEENFMGLQLGVE